MKAQASAELIALLGMLLLAIAAFAAFSSDLTSDLFLQQNYEKARESVQTLAKAADSVYAQGEGTTQKVLITVPGGADMSAAKSYIGRPSGAASSVTPNAINLNIGGSDITAYAKAPLIGSFPNAKGTYSIAVTSHGSYVSIGTDLVEVSPTSIYIKMAQGSSGESQPPLAFFTNIETVRVELQPNWGYASPKLSLQPQVFSVSGGGMWVPVQVTAYSNGADAGIYTSKISVKATGSGRGLDGSPGPGNSQTQEFEIPITVEIVAG